MKKKIYLIPFIALLLLFFVPSCENIEDSSIPEETGVPFIKLVDISPVKINTDSISIANGKNPDDSVKVFITFSLTEENIIDETLKIEKFSYRIINTDNITSEFTGDISTVKTSLTGNSGFLHSGVIPLSIRRKDIGNYALRIFGTDSKTRTSNLIVSNLVIIRENHPPVIEKIFAPDTIFISEGTQKYFLIAKVNDPEGNADIKKVYFNSYKPDGSPASGNPFQMFDDGNKAGISGDDKANDGLYSLTIQITDQNPKGRYRFDFFASDKSDSTSKVNTHYITVK